MLDRMLVLPMTTELGENVRALRKARSGDLAGFEQILRSHERQVLAVAQRLTGSIEDAKDVAQEAFLRLHKNLHTLEDADAIGRWLYRVTVNLCADFRRRGKPLLSIAAFEPVLRSENPSPEAMTARAEDRRMLSEALLKLGQKERAALVLRDMEGLSTAEVAQVLGSTEATVRVQVSKARLKLRELIRQARGES